MIEGHEEEDGEEKEEKDQVVSGKDKDMGDDRNENEKNTVDVEGETDEAVETNNPKTLESIEGFTEDHLSLLSANHFTSSIINKFSLGSTHHYIASLNTVLKRNNSILHCPIMIINIYTFEYCHAVLCLK